MKKGFNIVITSILMQLVVFSNFHFARENGSRQEINRENTQKVSNPLLNTISVDMDNVPFEKVLSIIANKGKFKLNYNLDHLPIQKKITIKMSNVPAVEVLQKILNKTGTELRINRWGYYLIIKKNKSNKHGTIIGKICESSNHKNIPGVQINLLKTKLVTLTDENGEFIISNIPEGKYDIKLFYNGFKTIIKEGILIRSNRINYINVEMTPQLPYMRETVNVTGENDSNIKFPVSALILKREEICKAPGTAIGIGRTLKILPGTAATSDTNNDLIIRGGAPSENGFYVDNIEIPTINHIPKLGSTGGFYSALNPGLIQNIVFLKGGFSSDYGDRLSSIIDITLREGNREKVQGQIDLSMGVAGGVLEGPIKKNKGAWLVSFRESYLTLLKDIGLEITTAPETFDSQVKLAYDITPRHKFRFLNFYIKSTFQEDRQDMPVLHNRTYNQNTSGLNLISTWSNNFFSNTSIFYTFISRNDGEKYWSNYRKEGIWRLNDSEKYIGVRNTNFLHLNEKNKFEFGFQVKNESNRFEYLDYNHIDDSGKLIPIKNMNFEYKTTKYSLFITYESRPFKKLTGTIGFRGDYSSNSDIFYLSPRFNLAYNATDNMVLFGGFGVFRQTIPMNYTAFIPQHIKVKDMKAVHYMLGIEYSTKTGTKINLDAYYKEYGNLPVDPDSPFTLITDRIFDVSNCDYKNDGYNDLTHYIAPSSIELNGSGYSKGIELLIQGKLSKKFSYFFSGTLFRSRYRDLKGILRDRIYDNRYLLHLILGYKANPNLEFSVRWTVQGSAPYTPIDVEESIEQNKSPIDQSRYLSGRYPTYRSLDFRIDKRFKLKKSTLILYLDLVNTFNRENVHFYEWDNSINLYTGQEDGVPILPIFGVKYEF